MSNMSEADQKEFDRLIQNAISESDSAANANENAGGYSFGEVPAGRINYERSMGHAAVDLVRAQISLLQAQAILNKSLSK